MREIRVESLQKLKVTNGEVRMLPNSGELFLAFPRRLFKGALAQASATLEPAEELMALKERPQGARQGEFLSHGPRRHIGRLRGLRAAVRPRLEAGGDVRSDLWVPFCAGGGAGADRALYLCMKGEHFVEQAYLAQAVEEEKTLATGDECLRALSAWGRRCSSSHFELGREVWQYSWGSAERTSNQLRPTLYIQRRGKNRCRS